MSKLAMFNMIKEIFFVSVSFFALVMCLISIKKAEILSNSEKYFLYVLLLMVLAIEAAILAK